jgi:hypothetical protein
MKLHLIITPNPDILIAKLFFDPGVESLRHRPLVITKGIIGGIGRTPLPPGFLSIKGTYPNKPQICRRLGVSCNAVIKERVVG